MKKAVLISIRPEWVYKILSGQKSIEIRKTRPNLDPPFNCYIYCAKGSPYLNRHNGKLYFEKKDILGGHGCGLYERLSGRVVGEFVCDGIIDLVPISTATKRLTHFSGLSSVGLRETCLSMDDLVAYAEGLPRKLFGWDIAFTKEYAQTKPLSDFHGLCTPDCNFYGACGGTKDGCFVSGLHRPPQSWCYVYEP